MKLLLFTLLLCGLATAWSYHVPRQAVHARHLSHRQKSEVMHGITDTLFRGFLEMIEPLLQKGLQISHALGERVANGIYMIMNLFTSTPAVIGKIAIDFLDRWGINLPENIRVALEQLVERMKSPPARLSKPKKSLIDGILKSVLELVEGILEKGGALTGMILESVSGILSRVLEGVGNISGEVLQLLQNILQKFQDVLPKELKDKMEEIVNKNSAAMKRARSKPKKVEYNILDVVLGGLLTTLQGILKEGGTVTQILIENVINFITVVLDTVGHVSGDVLKLVQDILEQFREILPGDLKDKMQEVIDKNKSAMIRTRSMKKIDFIDSFLEKLLDKVQDLLERGQMVADNLLQEIVDVAKVIIDKVGGLSQKLQEKIQDIIQKLKDKIPQDLIDKLNKLGKSQRVMFRPLRL